MQLAQNDNADLLQVRDDLKKRINGEIPIIVKQVETIYNSNKQIFNLLKNDNLLTLGDNALENFVLENENTNHGKLERIEKNLAEGNLDGAQLEIMSLEQNAIDENFKLFDEIYIRYLNDTLDGVDSLNLINLGDKCPLLDGSVVYQARAMYGALFGYKYVFTDGCPKDGDEGEKSLTQDANNSNGNFDKNEILLYPNPSNGMFYIKTDDATLIQISDIQGRLVKFSQNKLDETTFEIEIDVENGVYNIQIINSNVIQNVKLKVFK